MNFERMPVSAQEKKREEYKFGIPIEQWNRMSPEDQQAAMERFNKKLKEEPLVGSGKQVEEMQEIPPEETVASGSQIDVEAMKRAERGETENNAESENEIETVPDKDLAA